MRPPPTWPRETVTLLGCALLVAGCSLQTKEKVLRVFFTGMGSTNQSAVTPTVPLGTNNAPPLATVPAAPEVHLHQPFAERNCTACHVTALSQELRASGSDLCRECHEKLFANAKYVHAPVNDGRCDLCHQSHESTEPFLLTRKVQDLCNDCHPLVQMLELRSHDGVGVAGCVTCHDPHRSETKKLVKSPP